MIIEPRVELERHHVVVIDVLVAADADRFIRAAVVGEPA